MTEMSENKKITINPELFKFSYKNKTQKKKPNKEMKIKDNTHIKTANNNTKKKKLLEYIQRIQEKHKKQSETNELFPKTISNLANPTEKPNSEFDESVLFFKELENNKPTPADAPTPTPTPTPASAIDIPINTLPFLPPTPVVPTPITPPTVLPYGILKNGTLPTYRNYITTNTTLPPPPPTTPTRHPVTPTLQIQDFKEPEHLYKEPEILKHKYIQRINEKEENKYLAKNKTKRKKTIRRKFKIGHSKKNANIGILLSNKTIRNQVVAKKQLLKQTPIKDVKQFLLKKGLIKIGTTAPNDVLRKMYETASLICGDIQNHNNDILLHNFFHNEE